MLAFLSRRIKTVPYTNAIRPLSSAGTPDITDPVFWEEENRPIANIRDILVHVTTTKNKHLRWEKSLEKLYLVGEISEGARRYRVGWGFAVEFALRTRTLLKVGNGYRQLDQFHKCMVHAELLQKMALEKLRTGVGVKVEGQIYFSLNAASDSCIMNVYPNINVETFDILEWPRTAQKSKSVLSN